MDDLLLTNATLAGIDGASEVSLSIRNGVVRALSTRGADAPARETIDASGLVVLPGAVDLHTHLREPGSEHKEDIATGTAAAARGGFTTVVMQPNTTPVVGSAEAFEGLRERAAAKAFVDFGIAVQVGPSNLDELPALRRCGALVFDIVTGDAPDEWTTGNAGELHDALRAVRDVGGLAGVYSVDASLVAALERDQRGAGRTDLAAFAASRPVSSESVALHTTLTIASLLGVRVLLRQVSTAAGIEMVARAKASGADVVLEVNPHHLFLTARAAHHLGTRAKVIPPLRTQSDVDALWGAIGAGVVDVIGTDHAPHERAAKEPPSGSVWDAAGGLPGLETALPLLLDAVVGGRLGLGDLVRLCATQPAKAAGLYPRKGTLAPGADADFVLVDMRRTHRISDGELATKAGWSPFSGRDLRGEIVATFVRGRAVYRDGRVQGVPGYGQFVPGAATGSG